ncbi:MAG: hypothetical protein ACHQIM_22345, partial [Sphingobacteriales bacterium]
WSFVKEFTDVFSADVVTKPARGGKFLKMSESQKGGKMYCEKCEAEIKNKGVKQMEKKQVEKMMQALDGLKGKLGKESEVQNSEADIDALKAE